MILKPKGGENVLHVDLAHSTKEPAGAIHWGKVYIPNARGYMLLRLEMNGCARLGYFEIQNGSNVPPIKV